MQEHSTSTFFGVSTMAIARPNESGLNVGVKNEHLVTNSVNDIIWEVIIKTTEIQMSQKVRVFHN
jgi:hypothetical protein